MKVTVTMQVDLEAADFVRLIHEHDGNLREMLGDEAFDQLRRGEFQLSSRYPRGVSDGCVVTLRNTEVYDGEGPYR